MNLLEILQFAPWIGYLISGLFGLIIGSFLTFITYRIKHKQPWAWGREAARSKCPSCNHVLAPRDLIPVLSWIMTGGQCRYCKMPISCRYPIIELATAIIFMILYGLLIATHLI